MGHTFRRRSVRSMWLAPFALGIVAACAGEIRRPNVPTSETVARLRRGAGAGLQDCGEAIEPKGETACKIHSVGECLQAALGQCRAAYGVRQFFTAEGDAIRLDWLVLSDGHGGCEVVTVEDRSADPLASKKARVTRCQSIAWREHEDIEGCERFEAEGCREDKPAR